MPSSSAALLPAARDAVQLELQCGTPHRSIVASFHISVRQVEKMARNLRLFGAVYINPKTYHKQGQSKELTIEHEEALISFILENRIVYQFKMSRFLEEEFNITVHQSTISRYLKRLRLTCKKIS